jgi:hypothetical protein
VFNLLKKNVHMRKYIFIIFSLIIITICGLGIFDQIKSIDILPNYSETHVKMHKQNIISNNDLDACQKEVLLNEVDVDRKNQKETSNQALVVVLCAIIILIVQLIMLLMMLFSPKKKEIHLLDKRSVKLS